MKATAHFHPKFGEAVAALPRKDRIDFYLFVMEQQKSGPLTTDFKSHIFKSDFKRQMHSWFPVISENTAAFFDTRLSVESFTYLHMGDVSKDESEQNFFENCAARYAEVQSKSVELLILDDLMNEGDPDDRAAALDIVLAQEKRSLNLFLIAEAKEEAKAHLCSLFNLSPTQFSRLETRVDFYLSTLQNSLGARGLALDLSLSAKDDIRFTATSFANIAKLK